MMDKLIINTRRHIFQASNYRFLSQLLGNRYYLSLSCSGRSRLGWDVKEREAVLDAMGFVISCRVGEKRNGDLQGTSEQRVYT